MKFRQIITALILSGISVLSFAQETGIEVDYNNPKPYLVGGVDVAGNDYFSKDQIIQLTGLTPGMEVTVPGDEISSIVKRLWLQKYFEDVALNIDHLSADGDSAYFMITIKERPRVAEWAFTGVKSGEKKELMEKLHVRRGDGYSETAERTCIDLIKSFYAEKGYLRCTVTPQTTPAKGIKNGIKVNFAVDRGEKVKIRDINFIGYNSDVKEFKIAKEMKKTKSNKIYNFFSSKKFDSKEYSTDIKNSVNAFN